MTALFGDLDAKSVGAQHRGTRSGVDGTVAADHASPRTVAALTGGFLGVRQVLPSVRGHGFVVLDGAALLHGGAPHRVELVEGGPSFVPGSLGRGDVGVDDTFGWWAGEPHQRLRGQPPADVDTEPARPAPPAVGARGALWGRLAGHAARPMARAATK
jgi:hypothetical protein